LVIVLVFFGPGKLPSLGKSLGEAIRGFKKGLNDEEIDVTKREQIKDQTKDGAKSSDGDKQG
jgi:sec-independent protein translocase protein TatA